MIGAGAYSGVSAFGLGDLLGGAVKIGGINLLLNKYGNSVNSAINSLMMKKASVQIMQQK